MRDQPHTVAGLRDYIASLLLRAQNRIPPESRGWPQRRQRTALQKARALYRKARPAGLSFKQWLRVQVAEAAQ